MLTDIFCVRLYVEQNSSSQIAALLHHQLLKKPDCQCPKCEGRALLNTWLAFLTFDTLSAPFPQSLISRYHVVSSTERVFIGDLAESPGSFVIGG